MQIRQMAIVEQAIQKQVCKLDSWYVRGEKYPFGLLAAKYTQKHPLKYGHNSPFSEALRPTNGYVTATSLVECPLKSRHTAL
jgi:hypothetical protein